MTGGARSGKSRFAQEIAKKFPGSKAYLATAQALDAEMKRRINRHQEIPHHGPGGPWRSPCTLREVLQNEGRQLRPHPL